MKKLNRKQAIQLLATSGAAWMSGGLQGFTPVSQMLARPIPSSNELLPVVGIGSWIQFDAGNNAKERENLTEVLRQVMNGGGKLIDSSPMYGSSEEVIGDLTQAMKTPDHFFYATKVWTSGKEAGIRQMEASFRKMKRKHMNLMQIHNLSDWETQLKTLVQWKKEGKIRYIGITHYTTSMHATLQRVFEKHPVDFVQFNYSILTRDAEKSILPAAMNKGVAVIINEPLEKGRLFSLVKDRALPAWAKDYDIHSWAQYFLKYIVSHPAVNCVIPGTSNPKHAADNMLAGYGRLPDESVRKKMVAYLENL
ncbi:MAG: aldo/keto reductase [Chitinophagaceae bacterium]|nr:aldo/keto reductase [Chitinophagaceae bacterium]MCW5927216.1 aldo/keto reductase [Chitinophagaceae bacterium]